MLELIWIVGIILTVLVFGIIIGLIVAFKNISKVFAVTLAIEYGMGVLILTNLAFIYFNIAYKFVNDYNFSIFAAISIILIFTGFYTLKKWRGHCENNVNILRLPLVVLLPCCWGAVIADIVLASPFIEVSAAFVGQYAAVFLSLTILAFYFASGAIIRVLKTPYPVLLGNFMLFFGLYFLASAIVIPNISAALQSPFKPMNMPSIETVGCTVIFVVLLAFIGFYMTKKQSNLIQR